MKTIRQNKGVFSGTAEELMVRAGLFVVVAWLAIYTVSSRYWPDHCLGILKAVGYHALGGRAAGISAGLAAKLPHWLVVLLAFTVDMTVVLLLYPLAVYSYERGTRRWLLQGTIESTIEAASTGQRKVARWGIVGIVFFVWFPLYMTGPLIGSVIGYFLGLRPWVNLTAVGSGTLLAIVSWTFIFDWLHRLLERVHEGLTAYVPLAAVVFVLLVAGAGRLYVRKKKAAAREAKGEGHASGGGREEDAPGEPGTDGPEERQTS